MIGGYQLGGDNAGCSVDIDTVYESVGAVAADTMTLEALTTMTACAIRGAGVCGGLGTANSMHILAEALGMTMPGSAPVRAGSERMYAGARAAGTRIVAMIGEGLTARKVLTPAAIGNAVEVALAIGASVNCVRHLAAIATEADLDLDVIALFEERSRDAVLLCTVRPNGPHRTEDLEAAGGAATVLRALGSRLDSDALTVSGKTVGELAPTAAAPDGQIISTLDEPARRQPGLQVLRGSLAPDGAIVKRAGVGSHSVAFSGPARVYTGEAEAIAALGTEKIQPGDVIVLRGMGPRGGPGTVFAAGFVAALVGAGLGGKVAVVTDGELSGLNHGLVVGQVMPEAADAGPLAAVQDGDTITIDVSASRIDTDPVREVSGPVRSAGAGTERGWLGQYRLLVGPIQQGAVLRRPAGEDS